MKMKDELQRSVAAAAWKREVDMWRGIIESSVPEWSKGGPWATPTDRIHRVEHMTLVAAHAASLAPAEWETVVELVRKVRA